MSFSAFVEYLVLCLLTIATLVSILDWTGFMPPKWSRFLGRNRLREAIDILKELGIDVERHKKLNLSVITGKIFKSDLSLEESLKQDFDRWIKKENVSVGKTEAIPLKEFLDVMGATVDPKNAELFARYLSTFWAQALRSNGDVATPDYDFVVTPKSGSPILGYEFAKLQGVPFVLHGLESEKFISENEKIAFFGHFDCSEMPERGKTALIVDDSATGGRKVLKAAEALRGFGYKVTDCLVLFEPQTKKQDIKEKLAASNVRLHSITKR